MSDDLYPRAASADKWCHAIDGSNRLQLCDTSHPNHSKPTLCRTWAAPRKPRDG